MKKELTKQDILDLFAKSDKRFNESLEKSRKKFDEELAKSRKEWKERNKERDKEWDEQMKELNKNIGGIGNSNGDVAEEFFYNGLERKMKVGEITFHSIRKNVNGNDKSIRLKDEFDIVLKNSDTILITESKYKAVPDHVDDLFNKKIPNFKKLFPEYIDFKIYGAIAGLSMPENTIRKAIEYGFFVLTQSGDNIKLLNDKVKCY